MKGSNNFDNSFILDKINDYEEMESEMEDYEK